jgi:hypothetical protein
MKLNSQTVNLVLAVHRFPAQTRNLDQALSRLRSLKQQEPENSTLYELLSEQNKQFQQKLDSLGTQERAEWILAQVQTHCRLVAWLDQGDDSNGGPNNRLPQPRRPATVKVSQKAPALPSSPVHQPAQPATSQPAQKASEPTPVPVPDSAGQSVPPSGFDVS